MKVLIILMILSFNCAAYQDPYCIEQHSRIPLIYGLFTKLDNRKIEYYDNWGKYIKEKCQDSWLSLSQCENKELLKIWFTIFKSFYSQIPFYRRVKTMKKIWKRKLYQLKNNPLVYVEHNIPKDEITKGFEVSGGYHLLVSANIEHPEFFLFNNWTQYKIRDFNYKKLYYWFLTQRYLMTIPNKRVRKILKFYIEKLSVLEDNDLFRRVTIRNLIIFSQNDFFWKIGSKKESSKKDDVLDEFKNYLEEIGEKYSSEKCYFYSKNKNLIIISDHTLKERRIKILYAKIDWKYLNLIRFYY